MSNESQPRDLAWAQAVWGNLDTHLKYNEHVFQGHNPYDHDFAEAASILGQDAQITEYAAASMRLGLVTHRASRPEYGRSAAMEQWNWANNTVGRRVEIQGLDAASPPGSEWAIGRFAKVIGVKFLPAYNIAAEYEADQIKPELLPVIQQSGLNVSVFKVLIDGCGPIPRYYHGRSLGFLPEDNDKTTEK